MTATMYDRVQKMKDDEKALLNRVESNPLKRLILNDEGTYHSKAMLDFYKANPLAAGCPDIIRIPAEKDEADLPFDDFASTKLDPQETTSPKQLKGTYRAQFLQGKESEYKATVEAFEQMTSKIALGKIFALDNCRRWAHFAFDNVSGSVRVMTDSCRQRWCPMCAGQKSKYAKESTKRWVESLHSPRFLTLTLRNEPGELLPQVQFLQDCFRRLRQRAFWKKKVTGGIWFLQVKRGKNSGCWHPHLHILIDGEFLEAGQLSDLWDLVTYGSPIIEIRRIDNPEKSADYVARYSARPATLDDMPIPDRIEVIEALHGKRLSGTFGTAKSVTLTPPKIEDSSDWVTLDYYDKIINDAYTNKAAAAVLKAYKMEEPVPAWVIEVYSNAKSKFKVSHVEQKKCIQLSLDFFNSS